MDWSGDDRHGPEWTSTRNAPFSASTRRLPESIFHPVTSEVSNIRNLPGGTVKVIVPSRDAEVKMVVSSSPPRNHVLRD